MKDDYCDRFYILKTMEHYIPWKIRKQWKDSKSVTEIKNTFKIEDE